MIVLRGMETKGLRREERRMLSDSGLLEGSASLSLFIGNMHI